MTFSVFPMGQNSITENPEEAWQRIKVGVDKILSPHDDPLTPSEFMKCYTCIHDFCSKAESDETGFDAMNINIGGKELYYFLKQHLQDYLSLIVSGCPEEKESILIYYKSSWRDYTRSALTLHNLFNYLNRMWIKRKLDEQSTGIYDIYTASDFYNI